MEVAFEKQRRQLLSRLWSTRGWQHFTLAQQFIFAAVIVLLVGMLIIGFWVSDTIKRDVTSSSANSAALYMQATIAPLIQDLETSNSLSPETISQLNQIFEVSEIRHKLASMKVWRQDGTIVYSKWPDMIGKHFPVVGGLAKAANGDIAAEFNNQPHDEDRHERELIKPLLEIYAPIRSDKSARIIGVAEFYVDGTTLARNLTEAMLTSWLVVGFVTLTMLAALTGIVRRGSTTIERQREQLSSQIVHLHNLLLQNERLNSKLKDANVEVAEVNERLLQKISAELHDGPTQLLTYALMRLGRFGPAIERAGNPGDKSELQQMNSALSDALREIRNISVGLSLPALDDKPFLETIKTAIQLHTERTGSKVSFVAGALPQHVPQSLNVCAYRFVQEALTNAFRHAAGQGQLVNAALDTNKNNALVLSVSDNGPGMTINTNDHRGLGLIGLRARIEALGGKLEISSSSNHGVKLTATFDSISDEKVALA